MSRAKRWRSIDSQVAAKGAEQEYLSPDGYELDIACMARPGAKEIQLGLIIDSLCNVVLYPAFQACFREYQPPLPGVWGRHDPAYLPTGAAVNTQAL